MIFDGFIGRTLPNRAVAGEGLPASFDSGDGGLFERFHNGQLLGGDVARPVGTYLAGNGCPTTARPGGRLPGGIGVEWLPGACRPAVPGSLPGALRGSSLTCSLLWPG